MDGTQDHFVVREAGVFWQELHMRTKINAAVADVYEEVREGRLSWNVHDAKRLIKPYRKHKHIDAILEKMSDDTWVPEGEAVFVDDDAKSSSGSSDDEGEDIEAADAADVIAVADAADEAEAETPLVVTSVETVKKEPANVIKKLADDWDEDMETDAKPESDKVESVESGASKPVPDVSAMSCK